MIRVLFVCLGNICRSPMAEAVFQQFVKEAGLETEIEVDSAGTSSWHVGELAHPETRKILAKNGISYGGTARSLDRAELSDDRIYIVAMDESNVRQIRSMTKKHDRVFRLLEFSIQTAVRDVPDPYYNGDFEAVYSLVEDGCRGLLKAIRDWEGI
ncbi:MAG: low molecular weight protein-tyrosine-phosphatase [Candidatus Promineifilaceae bacterium]